MTPVVVQHSFGEPNSGGPITALGRILDSRLADKYEFVRMHQPPAMKPIDLRLLRQWVLLLRHTRPDLVHVRGLGNEAFRAVLAARLAGCPRILVSVHGTVRDLTGPTSLRRRLLTRVIEPATLRMATHLATVCQSAARRDFLAPYRSKIAGVIPNGVDPPTAPRAERLRMRAELELSPDARVCVVIGRLSIEKGHLVLAEALRKVIEDAPSPTVLGGGDGPDHERIAQAYGSVEGVDARFLGRRHDVAAILDACDIFVFPTLHENLSNALLEGMAAGLPVVATAVGGNVEVLERGGGILVPPSDPHALADALVRLLTDPDLRARYGRQAREVVRDHYTVDQMVTELDRVYRTILGTKANP
jgi:glycosyltransferase involved in cell wall biosynthesis